MGKRGSKPFEEEVGLERFEKLLKTMKVKDIADLFSVHERTVLRAKERFESRQKAEVSYAPIEAFEAIPEIQNFIEYQKAKNVGYQKYVPMLKEYWGWIREDPALSKKQRPALWDLDVVQFVLAKLSEKRVALYQPKQALRRFFESQGSPQKDFLDNPLLKARRKDMRSPNGHIRAKDYLTYDEFQLSISKCNDFEAMTMKLHVSLRSREGDSDSRNSLLGLEWDRIHWEKNTADVYEPKTGGGTLWCDCPIDLWFSDLPGQFKKYWESKSSPLKGQVFEGYRYDDYVKLFERLRKETGLDVKPHDMRRTGTTWLIDAGVDTGAILGDYNPTSGRARGITGVGWENPEIFFQRYGRITPRKAEESRVKVREFMKTLSTSEKKLFEKVIIQSRYAPDK